MQLGGILCKNCQYLDLFSAPPNNFPHTGQFTSSMINQIVQLFHVISGPLEKDRYISWNSSCCVQFRFYRIWIWFVRVERKCLYRVVFPGPAGSIIASSFSVLNSAASSDQLSTARLTHHYETLDNLSFIKFLIPKL